MVFLGAMLACLLMFGISRRSIGFLGSAWAETKHRGEWHNLLAWISLVMSVQAFVWCQITAFAVVGTVFRLEEHSSASVTLYAQMPAWFTHMFVPAGGVVLLLTLIGCIIAFRLKDWAYGHDRDLLAGTRTGEITTFFTVTKTLRKAPRIPKFLDDLASLRKRATGIDWALHGIIFFLVFLVSALLAGGLLVARALLVSETRRHIHNFEDAYNETHARA